MASGKMGKKRKALLLIVFAMLLFLLIEGFASCQNAWNPNPHHPSQMQEMERQSDSNPAAHSEPSLERKSDSYQTAHSKPVLERKSDSYQTAHSEPTLQPHGSEPNTYEVVFEGKQECHGIIKGHVYNSITKEPVESAAIDCGSLCKRACPTADSQGFYSFSGLDSCSCPNTAYRMTCGAEGYISATNTVMTDGDGNAVSDFYLNPISQERKKVFKIWVGDKNSKNLPGAEVFVDGASKGVTDSRGEVRTEVTFGRHTVMARADCGEASKDYEFSDSIDGVTIYINTCPMDEIPSGSTSEIKFAGTAIEFIKGTLPGAPGYWTVSVDNLISGPQPCDTKIEVITYQAISPDIWGSSDNNIASGDKVEVYGAYVEDEKGCHVTLHGSNGYYIKKGPSKEAAMLTVQGEVLTDLWGSPSNSDNMLNIRVNKIIYNPQNIILPIGSIITVHSDLFSILSDCVKGRCYEFSGYWLNGAIWVKSEVKSVECPGESKKQGCGQIIRYDISNSKYPPGQIILADMEYKSNLATRGDFKGVLLLRSPTGSIYSNWKKESTPAYGQDSFGYYNKGNAIDVRIPEDAALGSYDAKLELRQYDTNELCAETDWLKDKFEVVKLSNDQSACARILKYDISNGNYPRGQIILADLKYKSNLNSEADFTGILKVRSPADQIYTGSEKQRTAANSEDNFGYGKGNSISIKIPDDAPIGKYAAKLEIHRSDTEKLCDSTQWIEDQFTISGPEDKENFEEIKFQGKVINYTHEVSGALYYQISIDKSITGPSWSGQLDVCAISIFEDYPVWGRYDTDLIIGDKVEVYGRCIIRSEKDHSATLNGRKEYYINKLENGPGCRGIISGHVYDACSKKPIGGGVVWAENGTCNSSIYMDDGKYELSSKSASIDKPCKIHFCPLTSYIIHCKVKGYISASKNLTTDSIGNSEHDFYLSPIDQNKPKLVDERISPHCGKADDLYTFSVFYKDEDGDKPADAYIRIYSFDGAKKIYDTQDADPTGGKMTRVSSDTDPTKGILFSYKTKLPKGEYRYYYYFSNVKCSSIYLPPNGFSDQGLRGPIVGMGCCRDVKFKGVVTEKNQAYSTINGTETTVPAWKVDIYNISEGPKPTDNPIEVFIGEEPKGSYNKSIQPGDSVEVYGCYPYDGVLGIFLNEKPEYYIKKIAPPSASPLIQPAPTL